ncbi:MAG: glycerophosphodiester phosphodiesterase family protein, partial [Oceanococcus sp.]
MNKRFSLTTGHAVLCLSLLAVSACNSDSNGEAVADSQEQEVVQGDYDCSQPVAGNPWLERRPINFSHRGGAVEFPENTLYSYKRSVEVGADVLEMDVYETADGELVVLHDVSIDRTTNGTGDVSSYTVDELKAFDAAHWFVPGVGTKTDADEAEYIWRGVATGEKPAPQGFDANDFRIPTLAETLDAFPDVLINIELKPDPDSTGSYEGKVAELLIERQRSDDVIVASFIDPPALLFKAQAPCVSTSYPTGQAALAVLASQGPLPLLPNPVHHAFQVPPSVGVEVGTQDFVDAAHA